MGTRTGGRNNRPEWLISLKIHLNANYSAFSPSWAVIPKTWQLRINNTLFIRSKLTTLRVNYHRLTVDIRHHPASYYLSYISVLQSFCSTLSDAWLFNTRCILSSWVIVTQMMLFDDAVNCRELVFHKWLRSVKITHPQLFGKLVWQNDSCLTKQKAQVFTV